MSGLPFAPAPAAASDAVPPTRRPSRWRAAAPWIAFGLFLPVALFGLLLPVNEYRGWGGSGVDCDGPTVVLMFAVPAAIVYAFLGLLFTARGLVLRSRTSGFAVMLCALLLAGLWPSIRAAQAEFDDHDYRQTCAG